MKTDMEEIQELVTTAIDREIDIERRHRAFGEIVKRFQDMAYGCAYAVLGDFQLAEDAAQEAFIAAYRDLDKLKDARAFPSWFKRIVLGESHRLMRGKHLPTEPIEAVLELPSDEEGPAEAVLKNELKDQVLAAIAALPENQRMVTTLFYINGYSQNEIADFLEIPAKTVKSRLHTARKQLKERMITMVQDTLQEQVPSRDSKFVKDVLFKAIERADRQKVSELLKEDPMLVNAQDETGRTPMEVLTSFYNPNWFKDPVTKRIAIYELLKAKGAMPDLVAAIVASDVAQVRKLVKADPNLVHQWIPSQRMPASECGRHGFFKGDIHPLTFAVKFGHIQVMEILLEAGADVNADSDQALHEAAWSWPVPNRQNIREVIDWLVAHGAKVNPYYKEPSPLMIAARYHRSETVKALLENGADANACVESVGGPPLAVAISAEPLSGSRDERHKSIEWLIKAGATYNDDRNPDDAITAIYRGRVDLLEKHLSVNPQLIHERLELTPNSADALFVDDVPYTWEYFGRVYYTHCPINGGTLLHLAAEYDEDAIAAFLLGRGADINARAKQDANGVGGHTPIFNAAASYYCSRVFELLVERGADLTIKATFLIGDGEKLELTPLSYTKLVIERSGYTDESMKQKAIDLLRKHGASE